MAAELKDRFGVEATLVKGDKGVFEIIADGKLVFSKKNLGRFPDEGEVAKILG